MRARAAGLVLLAIVREAGAAGCTVDPQLPYQASIYEAVSAGVTHTDVTLPDRLDGFNRTVSVEGLCDNAVTSSSAFTCQSTAGEFHAGLAAAVSPVTLHFGPATCQMTGISVYKTGQTAPAFEAEMRLIFEGCLGSPKGIDNAAVVVGITKDPVKDVNLLAWSKEVCKTVTSTTVAPVQVSQQTDAFIERVGDGRCDATERRQIENIDSQEGCKLQCMGSATSAQLLGNEGCRGFSFNSAASGATCITYSGNVLKASTNEGWQCYNLSTSVDQMTYGKSTPAPPTIVKDVPQELYVQQALGQSGMAYLHEISPPKDHPTCFKPMWWFKLEDREGRPVSVSMPDADFAEFMKDDRIPVAGKTQSVISAPMVLDRVLFNTCSKSEGWSEAECSVAPVKSTQCRSEEETTVVVSGVITSILTWFLVGVVFKITSLAGGSSPKGGYEKLNPGDAPKSDPVCNLGVVAFLGLVAACGSFGCCMLSMQFLNTVLRSAECYDYNEFLVVILCVVIATAVTIICILAHMAQYRHAHPMVRDVGAPAKNVQKGSNLMLIDVEEGAKMGSALDSIQMQQQGNVVTGFRSQNSPMNTPNSSFQATGGPAMTTGGQQSGWSSMNGGGSTFKN